MHTPATALQLLQTPEYEQIKAPFQRAVQEWIGAQEGNWQRLVVNPRSCGLQGQMAFNERALEPFLGGQFRAFWDSLSEEQRQLFGRANNRMGWRHFFLETAATMFDATLMNAIEQGLIPHPDGKVVGTERAGMPGSLEDDTARAKGSMTYDLEQVLAEHLKYYSSGNAGEDQQFMDALIDYLGLDIDRANALMSRVLEHHGLPNLHKARRTYGALLQTALLQCYGKRDAYWRTTPEEIVPDQVQSHSWPKAYRQLPLLDAVLESSLWFYDPVKIEACHADLVARHPQDANPEHEANLAQGQRIIDALQAFRTRDLGEGQV